MKSSLSILIHTLTLVLLVMVFSQCTIISGNGNVITKNIETENYDAIQVEGSMDVELVNGTEGNIEITAEENIIDYIVITVKDNTLIIDTKDGVGFSTSKGIKVKVPFEELSRVTLNGSGDIETSGTIHSDNFKVELEGSGDITLDLNTRSSEVSLDGSGDITLTGKTYNLVCVLDGSGDIDTQSLKAQNVTATLDGSGDIGVYAGKSISATLDGSGDITYEGNPDKVNVSESGSGDIRKMD